MRTQRPGCSKVSGCDIDYCRAYASGIALPTILPQRARPLFVRVIRRRASSPASSTSRRARARTAIAARPAKATAVPKRSARYPAPMVLKAAPIPVALPTMPCARLKRPVPREMSARASGTRTPSHGAGNAVERLHGHDHVGIVGPGQQRPAQRQRGETDQEQRPPAPALCEPADGRRDQRRRRAAGR